MSMDEQATTAPRDRAVTERPVIEAALRRRDPVPWVRLKHLHDVAAITAFAHELAVVAEQDRRPNATRVAA